MASIDTTCQEIERLDNAATGSDNIESVRECIRWPLDKLSPLLLKQPTWKRHVWLILHTLLPPWAFVFTSNEDRQALVTTLVGSSLSAHVSLPLLLDCLNDSLDLYSSLLKHYVSRTMVTSYLNDEWSSTFCSLLCSIPSRLANAYGLQGSDDTWYSDRYFYTMLTKHIAQALCTTRTEGSIAVAGELVGKMIRQGYQDICIDTLLPIAMEHPTTVWDHLWTCCERTAPMEKLYGAILRYINKYVEPLRQRSSIRLAIQSIASRLSPVLFAQQTGRLDDFLVYILTPRMRWVDDVVLRLVVAIAVHAAGLEPLESELKSDDLEWKLSPGASDMITKHLLSVVDCWTDPVLIKQMTDGERQFITTALLILFGYTDRVMMEEIQRSTGIVKGISAWFSSADEATAKLAMIVAESMSVRTKDQGEAILDFGIPMDQRLKELKELALVADGLTKVDKNLSLDLLLQQDDLPMDDMLDEPDQGLDPDTLMVPDDDEEEDSDLEPYPMEEESDNDEDHSADPKKKKARAPVYMSELMDYLKDQEDPEKLEIGLGAAESIIRQKSGVGFEVAEWAIQLGKRLIYFPETYEIDNYQRLQQLALVALMVACPDKITSFIIDQFFSQNTSIGQKNMILAAISMAALELSGWDSYNKDVDVNMELLDLADTSTKSGTLVFSSRRAEVELKRQQGIIRNRLSGLAGPIFFFPLVTGWWEASQLRLRWMTQDPMMVERFIMTLNVIMQCASNTPDKKKIVKEYFDYASSLRHVPTTRILRALLLGINTIIHICYKDQGYLLLANFTVELSKCQQWLEDIMGTHQQETELQQLTLKLLVSIGQLAKLVSHQP